MSSNARGPRFGNTGLLAETVYENFEVCLMLMTGLVVGGLMTTVIGAEAGTAAAVWTGAATSVAVALAVMAADLFYPSY